jgi:hypothetical protein
MPVKPTDKEQEYFAQQEYEKLRKQAEEHRRKMEARDREELRKLHFMHCPKCGMGLTTVRCRDVDVDACGACGGLWLDAGEMEKLTEGKTGPVGGFFGVFRRK